MEIVRKLLTADEITPPNVRYNGDCDCVQSTFDGGTTWVDNPGADPRISPAFRAPALATADPRCDAAANMVAFLRSLIDADLNATTALGLVSLWFGILFLVFPIGIIADILILIADAILGIGSAAIVASFTEPVYADLLCVFYCNIGPDGQMSDAQLSAIYAKIGTDFDVTVQAVFGAHSSGVGPVGWSNAGALGTETGDCSACDCGPWCYLWPFAASDGGWVTFTYGVWTGGVGWESQALSPDVFTVLIVKECAGGCNQPATTVTITATWTQGAGVSADTFVGVYDHAGSSYDPMAAYQLLTPGTHDYVFDVTAYGPFTALAVNAGSNSDTGGSSSIQAVQIEGTATEPIWTGGEVCS